MGVVTYLILVVVAFYLIGQWKASHLRHPAMGEARGRVVEHESGRAVSGATVLVRSHSKIGLGDPRMFFTPWLVRAAGVTDSSGAFVVPYRKLEWADVSFVAPGFASVVSRPESGTWGEVRLRRSSMTAQQILKRRLSLDVARSTPMILLDLDAARVTSDSRIAEFALVQDSLSEREFEIRSVGHAGLVPIQQDSQLVGAWDQDCQAPESSYVQPIRLVPSSNLFDYFKVYDRNERRFGRMVVWLSAHVSETDASKGIVASVSVDFTLNPTGKREVCPEHTEEEAQVLQEIDSVRVGATSAYYY